MTAPTLPPAATVEAPADPARVSAVQAARSRIAGLLADALVAAEQAGAATAAAEVTAAGEMYGRGPTAAEVSTARRAEYTAAFAAAAAKAAVEAAIAEALTFGPLAEQDALPARVVAAPRTGWHDRTYLDDLAAERVEARDDEQFRDAR